MPLEALAAAAGCALLLASPPPPLSPEDFVVAGIAVGTSVAAVRDQLGPPERVDVSQNPFAEDSPVWTLVYPSIHVDYAEEEAILGISLQANSVSTARGLRVGDPVERVVELYGPSAGQDEDGHWDYSSPEHELAVVRVFLKHARVEAIYVGWLLD